MPFDLAAMSRRARNIRRSAVTIRDIVPPAVLATDLYRAAYAPTVAIWQAAIDPVMAEYERTLAGMVRDSAADVRSEIDRAAEAFNRIALLLTPELRRWAFRVEQWHRGKWRAAILTATGVDLQTMIGPEGAAETLETIIERNVALVRDVSAQAQSRISDSVFRGLTERRQAREVAKEVREAVAMSRARSVRIASDQLTKVTSALADERRREAGIDVWKWRHSGKLHPRQKHRERDGNLYADTASSIGEDVDGKTVAKPPEDLPGRLPFCGCRSQAVLTF